MDMDAHSRAFPHIKGRFDLWVREILRTVLFMYQASNFPMGITRSEGCAPVLV